MTDASPTAPALLAPREAEAGAPELLRQTADAAIAYRAWLAERRVGARPGLTSDALRATLGGPVPESPTDPAAVIDALVAAAEPGLVTIDSSRYFGFVMGGSVPAALAADWLTSAWDQNVGLYLATPTTRDVVRRVQDEGTAWFGGTTYHGTVAARISVSNWATTEEDGRRTVEAIGRCLAEARAARRDGPG